MLSIHAFPLTLTLFLTFATRPVPSGLPARPPPPLQRARRALARHLELGEQHRPRELVHQKQERPAEQHRGAVEK
eukprot:1281332-Prymnesium_polylepis.1